MATLFWKRYVVIERLHRCTDKQQAFALSKGYRFLVMPITGSVSLSRPLKPTSRTATRARLPRPPRLRGRLPYRLCWQTDKPQLLQAD